MINKRKRIQKFLRFLQNRPEFRNHKKPDTLIAWKYLAVQTKTGVAFGVMCYDPVDESGDKHEVYIAVAGKLPKSSVMECLGHEYAHYLRYAEGVFDDTKLEVEEEFAERCAVRFVKAYEKHVRRKRLAKKKRREKMREVHG